MNIIGDIAGNLKTLQALLKQMPKGDFISLGDMIDRGPRSKQVLDFIMQNGQAVLGNHEHLLIDKFDSEKQIFHGSNKTTPYYPQYVWFNNGGLTTMDSFYPGFSTELENNPNLKISAFIDDSYINWLKSLPLYLEGLNYFLSHAPKHPLLNLQNASDLGRGFYHPRFTPEFRSEASLLWFRGDPAPMKDKLQVYGHNAYNDVLYHTENQHHGVIKENLDSSPIFALGIDTSASRVLTGLHLETMTIYQQKYID